MFKPSSRTSSRHQSSESINDLPDREEIQVDNESINIVLDGEDLEDIIKNKDEFYKDYNSVNLNPLGKILIRLATKTNKVLSRQKEKEELISIPALCQAFKENLACEQKEFNDKLEIEKINIKDSIIQNDLSYHTISPKIKAPAYYSPVETFNTPSRNADIIRLFPKDRSRFSGIEKQGPEVCEFLFAMNLAQSKCKLSKEEFLERLVSCCTQEAHNFVRALVGEGDSPENIYYKLLILYDKSPSPEQAKNLLLNYKVKRTENLATAQAFVLDKASLIAKMCTTETERRLITDFESIQALPRSLPSRSEAEVHKQYRLLMARLNRPPTFIELVSALAPLRVSIDEDILHNGVHFSKDYTSRYNAKTPQFKFRTSTFATHLNRKHASNAIEQNFQRSVSNRGRNQQMFNNRKPRYTVNSMTMDKPYNNQFINKNLTCLLCGRLGHTASQQCYQLKDAQGRSVPNVSPSQDPCSICLKQTGKRLFHPEKYCFIKNNFASRNNKFHKQ